MKKVKIYKLVDPITLEIRYIGITKRKLIDRLRGHLSYNQRSTYKNNWIRKLQDKGLKPLIELIEEVPESKVSQKERYYIAYYRQITRLTNVDDGGNTGNAQIGNTHWLGKTHKESTKKKMRKSRLRNFRNRPELREGISKSNSKRLGILNPRSIKVKGTDIKTGKSRVFVNIREAEKILKNEGVAISSVNIGQAVKGRYKTSGGYTWEKYDEK